MSRRFAAVILGVLWIGYGVEFIHITELPSPFPGWEDARGWVWLAVGIATIATISCPGWTRWLLVTMAALVGERLAILGIHMAHAHVVSYYGAETIAWATTIFAVILTASLPDRGQ